jgi:hypothetical protein
MTGEIHECVVKCMPEVFLTLLQVPVEPTQGQDTACGDRRRRIEGVCELGKTLSLELHVVEPAEDVLEFLEFLDAGTDLPRGIEAPEKLQEVSEFLGIDAETVQIGGRA